MQNKHSTNQEMNNHPNMGVEFDWIASDKKGRIALMCTAGYGNSPQNIIQWKKQTDEIIDWIVAECGLKNDDLLLAKPEKGIIIYDWTHWEGPYIRKFIPKKCVDRKTLKKNQLPIDAIFGLDFDFLETKEITDNEINTKQLTN